MSSAATVNSFFTPTQISGCQLWLDAADRGSLVLSGSNISRWNDKSSSGMIATPSNANVFYRSSAGYNGVYINNNNNPATPGITQLNLNSNFMNSSAYTIFGVYQFTTTNTYQTIFSDSRGTSGETRIQIGETQTFDVLANATLRAVNVTLGITRQFMSVETSSTGIFFYKNASLIGSNTTTGTTYSTDSGLFPSIGGPSLASDNRFMTGWIFEMVIYNSILSISQRQQVEGYLAWKWGLQANLPTSHPYKNSPIPPLLNPPVSLPSVTQNLQTITWFPSQVSGLTIWLDAADSSSMVLSGNNVTLWRDKSGNGKNATTNSPTGPALSNTPQFMNTSLYFDSTNYMLIPNNTLVNANGIFFVVFQEDTGQTSQKFVIQNYKAFGIQEFQYDTQSATIASGSFFTASFASRITSLSITAAEVLQTTGKLNSYTNGSQTQSISVTVSSATGDTDDGTNIGRYTFNNNEGYVGRFKGYLAEILYYNTTITASQRQQIEGYLAWKWGLQAKLPTSHPYKLSPPFLPTIVFPARSIVISASWQPTQISGIKLWFDAADTTTFAFSSGSKISIWKDKSGNGYNATQVNSPTYNSSTKVVTFNNPSAQYFTLPDNALPAGNSSYAYFIVFSFFSNGGYGLIGGGNYGSGNQVCAIRNDGAGRIVNYWWANDITTTNIMTLNTQQICEAFYNSGSTRSISLNFTGTTTSRPGTRAQGTGNNTLGKTYSSEYNNGTISEVVVYNTNLTTQQKQQVEGYLAWKWGLQANLPSNHPFKKWPPPPS